MVKDFVMYFVEKVLEKNMKPNIITLVTCDLIKNTHVFDEFIYL